MDHDVDPYKEAASDRFSDSPLIENMPSVEAQLTALAEYPKFRKKKELSYLSEVIFPGETVKAIDEGFFNDVTWLIFVTDQRVLFLSKGWFSKFKQFDIPLRAITAATNVQGILLGTIDIATTSVRCSIKHMQKSSAKRICDLISELIPGQSEPRIIPRKEEVLNVTIKMSQEKIAKLNDALDNRDRIIAAIPDEVIAKAKAFHRRLEAVTVPEYGPFDDDGSDDVIDAEEITENHLRVLIVLRDTHPENSEKRNVYQQIIDSVKVITDAKAVLANKKEMSSLIRTLASDDGFSEAEYSIAGIHDIHGDEHDPVAGAIRMRAKIS